MKSIHRTLLGFAALSWLVACGSSSHDDNFSQNAGGTGGTGGSGSGGKGSGGSGGSSATGGSGGTSVSSVALAALPSLYGSAACEAYTNCLGSLLEFIDNGEDCEQHAEAQFGESLSRLEEGVHAGRVVYDGTQMQACIDELRGKSCSELNDRESELCKLAVNGTVEVGQDCTMSAECKGFTYCKFGDTCPGTCENLELAGESCSDNDQCSSGLVCSEETSRCVAPAGADEACKAGEPDCNLGYFCTNPDADEATPGVCKPYDEVLNGDVDDECDLGTLELCKPGLACEVQTLVLTVATFACAEKVASGAQCHVAFPDECPVDEYCSTAGGEIEGTCVPRPGAGDPCEIQGVDPAAEPSICAPNTRCDDGICRNFASLGEGCQTDDVCLSEHCFDGACVSDSSCE